MYLFPHLINLAQDTCLRNYNILCNLVSKYFCFWNRLFSVCMNMQLTTLLSFKTSWKCVLMLKKIISDNLCKVLSHFHSWRLSCVHVYVLLESCCLYLFSCDLHLLKPEKDILCGLKTVKSNLSYFKFFSLTYEDFLIHFWHIS